MNGYYYDKVENDSYEIFFLYENSICLVAGVVKIDNNEYNLDDEVNNYVNLGFYKNQQYGWGLWEIIGDSLLVEKWLSGVGGPYPVGRYIGNIVNDSMIHIGFTYAYPPDGTEGKQIFKFHEFNSKPDSTNTFIE